MLSSGEYIKRLRISYLVILISQVTLLLISIFEIDPSREKKDDIYYMITVAIIFIIGVIWSYKRSSKHIRRAKRCRGIGEKLILYRKALYTRWLSIGLISICAIGAYIMTGADVFIFVTSFFTFTLLCYMPSIKKIINDLNLDDKEIRILQKPDAAL